MANLPDKPLADDQSNPEKPIVEIGWIVAGHFDEVDLCAVENARKSLLETMHLSFPSFQWKFPLLHREEFQTGVRVEPVMLLDDASAMRNTRRWDATFLFTSADLVSRYLTEALGVLSLSVETLVISTRRIDPRADRLEVEDEERVAVMTRRIKSLALHGLGHLFGLTHEVDPCNYMYHADTLEGFEKLGFWSDDQVKRMRDHLHDVADPRLEEEPQPRRPAIFYLSSAWINRWQILQAIRKAEPWKYPFRLSRLTAASVSALVILMVTAEVWDLGMAQNGWLVAALSVTAIVLTTMYVLIRQNLLVRRDRRMLTEQKVVTNLCTITIVFAGMSTTYLFLAVLALTLSGLLYHPALVSNWTESVTGPIGLQHYLILAGLVAALGIIVGALGASFENNHYFRHVTFIDEEM